MTAFGHFLDEHERLSLERENKHIIQWVDVKKEHPKPNTLVLVCIEYGKGNREIKLSHWVERTDCFDSFFHDLVTHWAYLPGFPNKVGEKV